MTWLVTGGAGYIGAHVVRALQAEGIAAVALDNLSTGMTAFVPDGVPLVVADVLDTAAVTAALREHAVTGVIHCAGYKFAGKSVLEPLLAYRQNLGGTESLLSAMAVTGVGRLVYSSSAAVYGTPEVETVTESTPASPESPYGESKLAAEWLIRAETIARAETASPLRHTCLRYFNVVGSGGAVYDLSPLGLFASALRAIVAGESPVIFGTDYPTPDGTCVRDYIDVVRLARAHVAAARSLEDGVDLMPVYNLGSGTGTSVREIMDAIIDITGSQVDVAEGPRRPGDPARIVAEGKLAERDLGWDTGDDFRDMIADAWAAVPKG